MVSVEQHIERPEIKASTLIVRRQTTILGHLSVFPTM